MKTLKTLKTFLGRVIRDIGRGIKGNEALEKLFAHPLMLARRVQPGTRTCVASKAHRPRQGPAGFQPARAGG